jgi:hypothetical protein
VNGISARCPVCDALVKVRPGVGKQAGKWVPEQHGDKDGPRGQGDMKAYGKRVELPCGHIGEHIVSQFVLCSVPNCSGKTACPKCGSQDVAPFQSDVVPPGSFNCWRCGRVWRPGA